MGADNAGTEALESGQNEAPESAQNEAPEQTAQNEAPQEGTEAPSSLPTATSSPAAPSSPPATTTSKAIDSDLARYAIYCTACTCINYVAIFLLTHLDCVHVSQPKEEISKASYKKYKLGFTTEEGERWHVMTHKCRGSIVVLSISKSVEPNEE